MSVDELRIESEQPMNAIEKACAFLDRDVRVNPYIGDLGRAKYAAIRDLLAAYENYRTDEDRNRACARIERAELALTTAFREDTNG